MDTAQRDRMAAMSGDSSRGKFPTFVVPEIRFDGNTGEFRKITKNEDKTSQETPIDGGLSVVVLKKRRVLKAFSNDDSWYTTEFSSPQATITLFHSVAGSTETLMKGTAPEIRSKYPALKTQEVLYVLYEGEVAKLVVRGGSSANYYNFQNKMRDEDKHSFEYQLVVGTEQKIGAAPLKKKYYAMTFSDAPLTVESDVVEAKMVEVNEALNKIDAYEASISGRTPKPAVDDEGWTADAPTVDAQTTDDIPF